MKKLHERWQGRVAFVGVLIRQAHPGPGVPPYRSAEYKLRDGERYRDDEGIPWPVLVDDLEGTVHQVYSGLADPTYLIDADGWVAYYTMWTHAPNLNAAIAALLDQGDRGVVRGGIDHVMHMLPALTDGWRGIRRGLPQSELDMELAAPGSGAMLWLGHQMRPVLAPVTLRAAPLPSPARWGLAALGALAIGAITARALRR